MTWLMLPTPGAPRHSKYPSNSVNFIFEFSHRDNVRRRVENDLSSNFFSHQLLWERKPLCLEKVEVNRNRAGIAAHYSVMWLFFLWARYLSRQYLMTRAKPTFRKSVALRVLSIENKVWRCAHKLLSPQRNLCAKSKGGHHSVWTRNTQGIHTTHEYSWVVLNRI
jgi:hypothetical protein